MHVHVGGDSGASGGAEVQPDVEALGVIDRFHHTHSLLNQLHHLVEGLSGEV